MHAMKTRRFNTCGDAFTAKCATKTCAVYEECKANNDRECEELHRYLVEKLGHNWRLETWRDKYRARIGKYGLAECKRAVDGFCTPPDNWYVRTVGHRAPELIFRSDKALETFLAKAPADESEARQQADDRRRRAQEYRALLERENAGLTRRFRFKIKPLKDRLNEHSWKVFIEPLEVVEASRDEVVLFSEDAGWVREHFAGVISEALGGVEVRVVGIPEG